jgi:hypothetical protein
MERFCSINKLPKNIFALIGTLDFGNSIIIAVATQGITKLTKNANNQ